MSDTSQGPGWWQASDGKWYPPEQAPGATPTPGPAPGPSGPAYAAPMGGMPMGGAPVKVSPGDAFNYGWLKFQQNIGPILIAAGAGFGILLVLMIIGWFGIWTSLIASAGSVECTTNSRGFTECSGGEAGFFLTLVVMVVLYLLYLLGVFLLQMAIIRGALMITYGETLDLKKMFSTENMVQYLVASLLVSVVISAISLITFCLGGLPGLVAFFFMQFYGFFILDKQMGAVDAIKSSVQLVNKNLGTLIGFFIGVMIAYFVGSLLCGIGLLLAIPVVIIATAYMYRSLQGEPVAP